MVRKRNNLSEHNPLNRSQFINNLSILVVMVIHSQHRKHNFPNSEYRQDDLTHATFLIERDRLRLR